jgi:hypothetical protein
MTVLARASSNCKRQTRPLVREREREREREPHINKTATEFQKKKIWS